VKALRRGSLPSSFMTDSIKTPILSTKDFAAVVEKNDSPHVQSKAMQNLAKMNRKQEQQHSEDMSSAMGRIRESFLEQRRRVKLADSLD